MQRVSKAKAKIQEKKNRKRLHIWQVHDSVQNTSHGRAQKMFHVSTNILLKLSNFPLCLWFIPLNIFQTHLPEVTIMVIN